MEYRSETRTVDGATVELATVVHGGREFTNLGAVVSEKYVAGYLQMDRDSHGEQLNTVGNLTDWQGNVIGTYRIVKIWRTPRSWVSDIMCAVHATVNGRLYKGRSAGTGMLFCGKLAKVQPRRKDGD